MAKKMHKIEIMEILDGMIRSDLIEGLESGTSIERKALIGAALSQLGSEITADAKTDAMHSYRGIKGKQHEGRIAVEYVPAKKPTNVDQTKVKELYPEKTHPELYKLGNNKEHIKFTIGPRPEPETPKAPPPSPDAIDFSQAMPVDPHASLTRDADGVLWSHEPRYVSPLAEAKAEAREAELLESDCNPETAAALRSQWEMETAPQTCPYCAPESQCSLCAEREIEAKRQDILRQLFHEFQEQAISAGNDPNRVARAVAIAQNPAALERARTKYLANALSCQCPDAKNPRMKCKHQLANIMHHNLNVKVGELKAARAW